VAKLSEGTPAGYQQKTGVRPHSFTFSSPRHYSKSSTTTSDASCKQPPTRRKRSISCTASSRRRKPRPPEGGLSCQLRFRCPRVQCRSRPIDVPEHLLNDPRCRPALQHQRGHRAAEQMAPAQLPSSASIRYPSKNGVFLLTLSGIATMRRLRLKPRLPPCLSPFCRKALHSPAHPIRKDSAKVHVGALNNALGALLMRWSRVRAPPGSPLILK